MSLGYALLHPQQAEANFTAAPHRFGADDAVDVAVAGFVTEDFSGFAEDLLGEIQQRLEAMGDRFAGLLEPGGRLSAVRQWLTSLVDGGFDFSAAFDGFTEFLAHLDPVSIRKTLGGWIDELMDALPELRSTGLMNTALDVVTAGLDMLKRPLLDGDDGADAHRAFRAATILEYHLRRLGRGIAESVPEFDVGQILRSLLADVTNRIDGPTLEAVAGIGASLKSNLSGVIGAAQGLAQASVQVDVDASGAPDEQPLWIDDRKVLPHARWSALWWTDLTCTCTALGHLIFDYQRTAPFRIHRFMDNLAAVLGMAWEATRGAARAMRPEFLQKSWFNWDAFWFSDLGDFCVHVVLTFLGSIHDMKSGDNFIMGWATRIGKYYTHVLQPRMPYLFGRSVWYLRDWGDHGYVIRHTVAAGDTLQSVADHYGATPEALKTWNDLDDELQPAAEPEIGRILLIVPEDPGPGDGEDNGRVRAPMAIGRYVWSMWFPSVVVCAIAGMAQRWEEFRLQDMSGTTTTSLAVAVPVGMVVGIVASFMLPWVWPWAVRFELDWTMWAFALAIAIFVLVIATSAMAATTNAVEAGAPWLGGFGAGGIALLLILPIALAWGLGGRDSEAGIVTAGTFYYLWLLIGGVVLAAFLPFILWWYYIDDGRDRDGSFVNLDVTTTPYLLPYPAGQLWQCGQAFHGIFSHTADDPGNHFAYDFIEGPDEPVATPREGIVMQMRQEQGYGSGTANWMEVFHLGWVEGHDPGTDDERVHTFGTYFHLPPDRIRANLSQRVIQGQHLVDIDDTGTSAQNHLHFAGDSTNTGNNVPVIFGDQSIRRKRSYPLFRAIEGNEDVGGKPWALAYYTSDNQVAIPFPHPIALRVGDGSTHQHDVLIDLADLPADGNPTAPLEGFTTVANGHVHRVTLSADVQRELLLHRLEAEVRTEMAAGHDHVVQAEFLPAGTNTTGGASRVPGAQVSVVSVPQAQLLARQPGPYDVLGQRLTLRVDDRTTEHYLFGAHRPTHAGELALDRGPAPGEDIRTDDGSGGATANVSTTTDATVRQAARELHEALTGQGRLVRAEPVLIVETRRRGAAARLDVAGNTDLFGLGGAALAGQGSGFADDLDAVAPADVRDHFDQVLNHGWPDAPAGVNVGAAAGGSSPLDIGGNAVTFSGAGRITRVLNHLYDPGTRLLREAGRLPLSTGRAVLTSVAGPDVLTMPVVATPAATTLEPTDAWLDQATVRGTDLFVTVWGSRQRVRFRAEDDDLDKVARRIVFEAEGVRAWNDGGRLRIETVAAGRDVQLSLEKAVPDGSTGTPLNVTVDAEAPQLSDGTRLEDSTSVSRARLSSLAGEAVARGNRGAQLENDIAMGAASAVDVGLDGSNRLELQLPGGHPAGQALGLAVAASSEALLRALAPDSANPGDPPDFEAVGGNNDHIRSRPLDNPVALPVQGWVDVDVDGDVRRVVLDGEPARVELGPLVRMPVDGDKLRITINGTGVPTNVDLNTGDQLDDIVRKVAEASDELHVRVGYRYVFEAERHGAGDLRVRTGSPGLAACGFFPAADLHDASQTLAGDLLADGLTGGGIRRVRGRLLPGAFTARENVAAGAIELEAESGKTLDVTVRWANGSGGGTYADPLGFAAPPAPAPPEQSRSAFAGGDLERACLTYRVEVHNQGVTEARTFVQLSAIPALVRGTNTVDPTALLDGTELVVRVTDPGTGESYEATVDLGWAAAVHQSLLASGAAPADATAQVNRDVLEQLQREVPRIRAWFVGGAADPRLHLETHGGGTDWVLRLEGGAALAALGFDRPVLDFNAGAIEVRGRGNVANGLAATRAEVIAAFQQAAEVTTGLANISPARSYQVEATATQLRLSATGGALTLVTEPPELLSRLAATNNPDGTVTLDTSSPLDLDDGWLLVERDGQVIGAQEVYGQVASARSPGPLPSADPELAAELNFLAGLTAGQGIRLRVDGAFTPIIAGFPAGMTTMDEAIEFIARQVPDAWIGLRPSVTTPGERDLVVQSRLRGNATAIELQFVGFAPTSLPHGSLLGCTANLAGAGTANVADLGAVTQAELQNLLEDARPFGGRAQALYGTSVDTSATPPDVRIAASDPGATLSVATAVPGGGVGLTNPPNRVDLLEGPFATGPVDHGPAEIEVQTGSPIAGAAGVTRAARSLMWGYPARLVLPLVPGTGVADFDGHTLRLRPGAGAPLVSVLFQGPVDARDLAAQIERQTGWRVRAELTGTTLILETFQEGEGAALELHDAPASAANDARNLFTGPTGLVEATGLGMAGDLDAVTPGELAEALATGFVTDEARPDNAQRSQRAMLNLAYEAEVLPPPAPPAPPAAPVPRWTPQPAYLPRNQLLIRSNRNGCLSSVIPLENTTPLTFERSFQRAPASRAAVEILHFRDNAGPIQVSSTGEQIIVTFNDNGPSTDLAPTTEVTVTFEPGSYDAQAVADRIHEAVYGAGVGVAVRFPDDVIVVESLVPGLAGSVELPVAGSTAEIVDRLSLDGTSRFARGWPGAFGIIDPIQNINNDAAPGTAAPVAAGTDPTYPARGYRCRSGAPVAGVSWQFANGPFRSGPAPVPVDAVTNQLPLDPGWSAAELARRLDELLAGATVSGANPRRIGHAKVGDDGTVQIEAMPGTFLYLHVEPSGGAGFAGVPVDPSTQIGATADVGVEPGMELRATDILRTYRLIYDTVGAGNVDTPAEFRDVGWIRPQTNNVVGMPIIPQPGGNYQTVGIRRWPAGRFLLAARSEAAKHDYGGAGEMVISGGEVDIDGETVHFVRRARYWIGLNRTTTVAQNYTLPPGGGSYPTTQNPGAFPLRVVQLDGEFFVYVQCW